MNKLIIPSIFIVFCFSAEAQTFHVAGIERSCKEIAELDKNLQQPNLSYFSGWAADDYDQAVEWSKACRSSGWQMSAPYRPQLLRSVQNKLGADGVSASKLDEARVEDDAIKSKASEAQLAQEAKERSKAKFMAMQAAEIAKVNDCHDTQEFRLYDAQETVATSVEEVSVQRAGLAQQRKIAAASGVRDLTEERRLGEWLVNYQDAVKTSFAEYRKLGGKATSPQTVGHKIPNPCM